MLSRRIFHRLIRPAVLAAALLLSLSYLAQAATFRQGVFAYNRQEDVLTSRIFIPLAEQGGVPRDIVESCKWLNLSTAAAPPRAREARVRIRDAVTTKMTCGEIARACYRAPSREG